MAAAWPPRSPLAAQLPGLLDVALHLLDQRVDRIEPPLAPQSGQEVDPQDLPVQVDVAVEQEGLDQHRPPGPNVDLYGKILRIDFLARLRGERRFDSVDALIEQMQRDVEQTRESCRQG